MAAALLFSPAMKVVRSYLRSFARPFTYDVRRNTYLWFGFLWGLPVPLFSILLDLTLDRASGRLPLDAILEHPIHVVFLAHPLLFALVFGAMGTVRHELERENLRLIETLRGLATTDPLTGLSNRRHLLEELQRMIYRARRSEQTFSVILIDLDEFKAVNEEQGHTAGDAVLQRVAQGLLSVARQSDVLARYGGDEFLFLVEGDAIAATTLLDRAVAAVQRHAGMAFSAGTASFPADGATPEDLIAKADQRQAKVKRKHRETTKSPARV